MTEAQRATTRRLLEELAVTSLTHGDCVGADAEVHAMALELGVRLRLRPANLEQARARCQGGELVAAPEAPLARNRKIVADGELLLAAPGMMKEQRRSGVWATIRHAIRRERPVYIIWPDGQLERR